MMLPISHKIQTNAFIGGSCTYRPALSRSFLGRLINRTFLRVPFTGGSALNSSRVSAGGAIRRSGSNPASQSSSLTLWWDAWRSSFLAVARDWRNELRVWPSPGSGTHPRLSPRWAGRHQAHLLVIRGGQGWQIGAHRGARDGHGSRCAAGWCAQTGAKRGRPFEPVGSALAIWASITFKGHCIAFEFPS